MERFAWLNAQPWIASWKGCGEEAAAHGQCKACTAGQFSSCELVAWSFNGFASFHINANDNEEGGGGGGEAGGVYSCRIQEAECKNHRKCCHGDGAVSPDALHLFFADQAPYRDPAQLELKIGFSEYQLERPSQQTGVVQRNVVHVLLVFEDEVPFIVDTLQIHQLCIWHRDHGCQMCNKRVLSLEHEGTPDKTNNCLCQKMPDHILVKFRHVALTIYSYSNYNVGESATHEPNTLLRLMERLRKAQDSANLSSSFRKRQDVDEITCNSALPNMDDVIMDVNIHLDECRTSTDSMCIAAVQAVEVCSADYAWMSNLLNTMAHAAQKKDCARRRHEKLHQVLQNRMQLLEVEEQLLIQTIWGLDVLQQKENKECSVTTLQLLRQKIEQLKEIMLIFELSLLHSSSNC